MGFNLDAQIDPPELFFNINVDRARSAVLVTEDGYLVSVNGNSYLYTNKINNTVSSVISYRPDTEFSIGKVNYPLIIIILLLLIDRGSAISLGHYNTITIINKQRKCNFLRSTN